jgi:hypothetical protein
LNDYGFEDQIATIDFLATTTMPDGCRAIVTNPPYGDMVEKFIRHGLKLTKAKGGLVALFLRNEYDLRPRTGWTSSVSILSHKKIVVTKRPRWIEGSTGSPRHNYAWFVWDWRHKAGAAGVAYSHPDFAPGPNITKH